MIFSLAAATVLTLACSVTDGDTIRCGDERIRITGIDAPETRACRTGRTCVPGDGQASKRALEAVVNGASLSIVRLGRIATVARWQWSMPTGSTWSVPS